MNMDIAALKECWEKEEQKAFTGWDFSYIRNRSFEEPLPWNYRGMVLKCLAPSDMLLDMETGGGEFLYSLNHPPVNTYATENWEPNYRLLMDTLAKEGVHIFREEEAGRLPFENAFFDRVTNRHGSLYAEEIFRILKPEGIFLTQQVGGKNNEPLSRRLIEGYSPPYPGNVLGRVAESLKRAGFRILSSGECYPVLRFYDVGALVWYAKAIKWEFPGFSVEKCFGRLLEIYREMTEKGFVESRQHRFYIIAQKAKRVF